MKNKLVIPIIAIVFTVAFLTSSPKVNAFSLGDIVNGIQNIFSATTQNDSLTVASKISLAPNGDINHNGQITSGDIVRFSYTIVNTTSNSYQFVMLKTNLDTKILNDISNVQGAANVDQNNTTIVIPNLTIGKNQMRKISFDAQINFNKDTDQTISTQPLLIDQNGTTIANGSTQSVTANKMDTTTFNKFVHITK